MNDDPYRRQIAFPPIGREGQARIRAATVFLAGCGAVGSVIASHLARAGIGRLIFADRDIVEATNLPRQVLFDRDDARRGLPKVEAAAAKLARAAPEVILEPHAVEIGPGNVRTLAAGADCIADGSDNAALRLLLNDAALELDVPWVYTGVIGGTGHGMTIPAGGRPCLRCYLRDLPPPGAVATCAQAGIIGPAVGCIASVAAAEVLRMASGHEPANAGRLTIAEIWSGRFRRVAVDADPHCPACAAGQREFLTSGSTGAATVLCGDAAVHLAAPPGGLGRRLEDLAETLRATEDVELGRFHLRLRRPPLTLTIFADGRAIVFGTSDAARARSLRDKVL